MRRRCGACSTPGGPWSATSISTSPRRPGRYLPASTAPGSPATPRASARRSVSRSLRACSCRSCSAAARSGCWPPTACERARAAAGAAQRARARTADRGPGGARLARGRRRGQHGAVSSAAPASRRRRDRRLPDRPGGAHQRRPPLVGHPCTHRGGRERGCRARRCARRRPWVRPGRPDEWVRSDRHARARRTAARRAGDRLVRGRHPCRRGAPDTPKEHPVGMTATSIPTLSAGELEALDAYWRAANYLSVGQIYLRDNPLLREPLRLEHVKPRLLGHWGTTPGLNLLYAHMNRAIRMRDLEALFVTGPGHGGPGLVANTWLEGSYSELYPTVSRDERGMRELFRQFSYPGGIPSHVAPETPGSIHEGGELGYALVHAYGAAFDNPDLLVLCVVGDGEAETGPLAASWHSNKFLDPARDGAVLPVLHLNGYKIANPTVLARIGDDELRDLMRGYGHAPRFVSGDDPERMHQVMAATLDEGVEEIRELQRRAREDGDLARPRWPMIVLRTPKGWTGPKEVDGLPAEG